MQTKKIKHPQLSSPTNVTVGKWVGIKEAITFVVIIENYYQKVNRLKGLYI